MHSLELKNLKMKKKTPWALDCVTAVHKDKS